MALVINANSLFTRHGLKVLPHGVRFVESSFLGGRREFAFVQIERVLMSAQFVLSFQVGSEVFSISTNPAKRRHQETIAALLAGVRAAHGLPTGGTP